jgi:ATP dependent DNA ligase-like protein
MWNWKTDCPFANLPEKKRTQWALTKEEMKNCVWLKPELVPQIEFTEWTPDGHLRHSKFVGLREDKGGGRLCGRAKTACCWDCSRNLISARL